ncbi:hypothetical protein MHU86_13306 [Fragilaria crotonensis]|nr:hypothetical protein MHU86_13306 [Fragilaria crotonensis]
MKQSEDTENDGDVDVSNASDTKDGTVINSNQLSVNDAAGDEANHEVVATNKKNADIAGVTPAEGGEFEDADESSPQLPNGKRERPPPSTGEAEVANNEPALSRPRTMDDNSKHPAPGVPAIQVQSAVPTAGGGTAPQPQQHQQQMTQNTIGMQPPPQLGFDPNAPGGGRLPPANMVGGSNALFPQARPLRDMQFPPRVGAMPENAMMSQHLLNQQLMMGGQGQLPLGFAGNPVALGQFGMGPFNGQFPSGGAPQGGFQGQVNPGGQGQEGAQPPGADPNGTPNTSQQQGGPPNNTMGGMPLTGPMPPGPGGPVGQMGFGGFGGRPGGIMPVMGFSGMPPGMPGSMPGGGMPDAALQQMMYHQRQGGLTEADAMRQRMMMASGIPPGPGGFHPSFLAATGGRLNNMNPADLRGNTTSGPSASPAVSLALACDDEHLSEYQIMVRKQLEVFEAQPEDVESNTQGRKKQVSLGQVGIRCKHCASLPLRQRGRGAVYYPAKLQGVYQAAQNMASSHLCESCQCIDEPLKAELRTLRERRDTASGGKQYWADGARALGLFEADDGLRLNRELQQQ